MINKILITLTICISLFLLSSFKNDKSVSIIGTYTVAAEEASQIRLELREDHHFYYQDFSNQKNKIRLQGNWILKGEKVILEAKEYQGKFHHIWRISENGNIAQSRLGLCFYRLCRSNNSQ